MADTLETLVAKQAITEALHRYCHALDRFDRAAADSVFHPDATADYGEEIFRGTGHGFLDWVWPVHEGMQVHSHQVTNILIEVDGDSATSETYVTVCLRVDDDTDIVDRGRYSDAWERRRGVWAITHRKFTDDIQQIISRHG